MLILSLFILSLDLSQVQTAKRLSCYACFQANISACNEKLTLKSCHEWENECVNMSFSYIEKNENTYRTVYERKCGYRNAYLGNCTQLHCSTPRRFNSSYCNAECCDENFCHSNVEVATTNSSTRFFNLGMLLWPLLFQVIVWLTA